MKKSITRIANVIPNLLLPPIYSAIKLSSTSIIYLLNFNVIYLFE